MADSESMEAGTLAAFERNWIGLFESIPNYHPGSHFWREDGLFFGLTGWPLVTFNVAVLEQPQIFTPARLEVLGSKFGNLPYSIQLNRASQAQNSALLQQHDFVQIFDDPLLLCNGPLTLPARNQPAQSQAISIRSVVNSSDEQDYCEVVAEGFDLPSTNGDFLDVLLHMRESWQITAWMQGKPVGAGTLVCCNGVAGIYNVATIPSARRQGVGTAIMNALHTEALARGYPGTALASSEAGMSLYYSLGYHLETYQTGYARADML